MERTIEWQSCEEGVPEKLLSLKFSTNCCGSRKRAVNEKKPIFLELPESHKQIFKKLVEHVLARLLLLPLHGLTPDLRCTLVSGDLRLGVCRSLRLVRLTILRLWFWTAAWTAFVAPFLFAFLFLLFLRLVPSSFLPFCQFFLLMCVVELVWALGTKATFH